ncbi:hypothetical protein [Vibrio apostichopi]|uniref:hypothetical protein n=1 Tax=Vibrio apostichopi TaxID=3035453 RepID=UPI002573E769|nr:hypothetical protein [Vibrio sp. FE10]
MSSFRISSRGVSLSLIIAISFSLVGCNSENDSGNTSQNNNPDKNVYGTLSPQDATFSTGFVDSYEIDLSSKVFSSSGGGFVLTHVDVLSDERKCEIESFTNTGFFIRGTDVKACNYRYYVSPLASDSKIQSASSTEAGLVTDTSSMAIARVAVSSDLAMTELVPISATSLVNEEIHISLDTELEKVGINLTEEFVLTEATSAYNYLSTVQIDSFDNQSIDYTPASDFTGIDRVLYTLEDSSNGIVLMGILDVAVGYEANQGFTIDDGIIYAEAINIGTPTDIDISDFVSSDDEDDYQLVYVNTFNADVASKDPLDISNKVITFTAYSAGYHYISFAVSDHNGAYDMGLIKVNVVDPNQSARWEGVSHLLDFYTAPPTALDSAAAGSLYTIALSDTEFSPTIIMAGYNWQTAQAHCSKIGASVPTVVQLLEMTNDIKLQVLHNWPTQTPYVAVDEFSGEPAWVDLRDDVVSTGALSAGDGYYLSCVKQGLMQVLPSSSDVVVADGVEVGKVFIELKLDGEPRPNTAVTVSVSSPFVSLDNDTVVSDDSGLVEFSLTSLKAETVTMTFDLEGFQEQFDIKFIGDEKTAVVTSETTYNSAQYQADKGNEVTAILKDQNNNPIEGYSVQFSVTSAIHPESGQLVSPIIVKKQESTDANGVQELNVEWDPQYVVPRENMSFDVTSFYTTSTTNYSESKSTVTFTSFMCGSVDNTEQLNAAGACIKVASDFNDEGRLFSSNPSIPFMERVGKVDGIDYTYSYIHHEDDGPKGGEFARFNYAQAMEWCYFLNSIELNGRSNWNMPSFVVLRDLYSGRGNMVENFGWPENNNWTLWKRPLSNQSGYDSFDLQYGERHTSLNPESFITTSCVSEASSK